MKVKRSLTVLVLIIALAVVMSSCKKDDDPIPAPVITLLELGLENSHIGYVGDEFHIEAEVVAEGKIDKIEIEMHPEEGEGEEIHVEFTEFAGLKNLTFHEHIEIPDDAVPGEYHFHFVVTDMEGNQSSAEDEVTIAEPVE